MLIEFVPVGRRCLGQSGRVAQAHRRGHSSKSGANRRDPSKVGIIEPAISALRPNTQPGTTANVCKAVAEACVEARLLQDAGAWGPACLWG